MAHIALVLSTSSIVLDFRSHLSIQTENESFCVAPDSHWEIPLLVCYLSSRRSTQSFSRIPRRARLRCWWLF